MTGLEQITKAENNGHTETPEIKRDFDLNAQEKKTEYTPHEKAEVVREITGETLNKSKETMSRLRYNRQKREQLSAATGSRETLEDSLNEMNDRLKGILSNEMEHEKNHVKAESGKFVNKVKKLFGLYDSTKISEDDILERVINRQINELGDYSRILNSDAKQLHRDYDRKKHVFSITQKSANQCVDDYETGLKELTSLQEQLTENIRSRNEYIQKRNKNPADRTLDSYVGITQDTITELEDQIQDCKDHIDTLENDVSRYENQLLLDRESTEEARTHSSIINNELTDAKKSHDTLVRLMDTQNGRRALVGVYSNVLRGRKLMDKADEISQEARDCILSSIEQVRQYQRNIKGRTSANQYAHILEDMRKERAESVQAALARRYGIQ